MSGYTPIGSPVNRKVSGGPGPSIINLPTPGCWRLRVRWSGRADSLDLRYRQGWGRATGILERRDEARANRPPGLMASTERLHRRLGGHRERRGREEPRPARNPARGQDGPKLGFLYPLAHRADRRHGTFITLLMSAGLTFGTISSLYGL